MTCEITCEITSGQKSREILTVEIIILLNARIVNYIQAFSNIFAVSAECYTFMSVCEAAARAKFEKIKKIVYGWI